MTHKLHDTPIEQIVVEHYLFDLGQSIEKTAEILDMDEEYVRKVHDDYMKLTTRGRNTK